MSSLIDFFIEVSFVSKVEFNCFLIVEATLPMNLFLEDVMVIPLHSLTSLNLFSIPVTSIIFFFFLGLG